MADTSYLRRLRALAITGLTWAVVWAAAGAVGMPLLRRLAQAVSGPADVNRFTYSIPIALLGFLVGVGFAAVLTVFARRRAAESLRYWEMGMIGAAGAVAMLTGAPLGWMLMFGFGSFRLGDLVYLAGAMLLSASCAIATLRIARRGQHETADPVAIGASPGVEPGDAVVSAHTGHARPRAPLRSE